jgi:hypothetical protein
VRFRFGEIPHSALDVAVTQQLLHGLEVDTALKQPRGERGAELMRTAIGDLGFGNYSKTRSMLLATVPTLGPI